MEIVHGDILKAVMGASKYTDEEADAMERAQQKFQQDQAAEFMKALARNQDIAKSVDIPTAIKEGELDQKTESHPHFANYDHSLDMKRDIGLKKGNPVRADGSEMEITDTGRAIEEQEGAFTIDWDSLASQLG